MTDAARKALRQQDGLAAVRAWEMRPVPGTLDRSKQRRLPAAAATRESRA
jgi:hypothetical protein